MVVVTPKRKYNNSPLSAGSGCDAIASWIEVLSLTFVMFIVDPISNWLRESKEAQFYITLWEYKQVHWSIFYLLQILSQYWLLLLLLLLLFYAWFWVYYAKSSTLTRHLTYSSSLVSGFEVCSKNKNHPEIFGFDCLERDLPLLQNHNFRTRSFLDLLVSSFWSRSSKIIHIVFKKQRKSTKI